MSYKCTKWLTTAASTSSTLKIGAGFSTAVKVGASVEVGAGFLGAGSKATFSQDITQTSSFNVEPANTEITINLLRTVQDLEYKWKAIFELLGKYSVKYENEQEIFQDVTTVLSGSKRQMYAFGSWSYPDTDVLRVVITDKYGNEISGCICQHELGKTKSCELSTK